MRCTLCHGAKTYLARTVKRRVRCPRCGGSGEVSDRYPDNPQDHQVEWCRESDRYRPSYDGIDPRGNGDLDQLFERIDR